MHIVIADNEEKTVQFIKKALEKQIKGVKIFIAPANTKGVLQKIYEVSPRLVILDVNLKDLNGLDIAKYLYSIGNKAEVILISSYNYFEFAREAIRLNVHDYLLKPLIESQLIESCVEALNHYRKKTDLESETEIKEQNIQEARRHIEYSLMYSALFNGEASEEIKNYKKMFLLGDIGYIINIEIDSFDSDSLINLKKMMLRLIIF